MSLSVACHRSGATGYMQQFLTCSEHGVVAEYDDPADLEKLSAAADKHSRRSHPAPKEAEPEPKIEPKAEAKKEPEPKPAARK